MSVLLENNLVYYIFLFLVILVLIGLWVWRQSGDKLIKTSILYLYSKDLTQLAEEGKLDPVIGRHHEIKRVIQILSRRTKNNPALIGKSGVGKTAIVEELANEIATGNVPDVLKGKKVLALDLSGLVAGTKYRGEFEKRLRIIVDEIIAAQRNIILFIDELHTLAGAGVAEGAIDASEILKPALARGQLQAIGATTEEDWTKYIVRDPTLERRFQPIFISEASSAETIKILKGIRSRYEDYHKVKISSEAIEKAVQLSDKYLPDRHFPDKAIDLIDEAASKVHLDTITTPAKYKAQEIPVVKGNDIEEIIHEWRIDDSAYHESKKEEHK